MENVSMISSSPLPTKEFWQGKKVLITGHTGFKGSWLAFWLLRLGANVSGISLSPSTSPNLYQALHLDTKIKNYELDIRNAEQLKKSVDLIQPEIVIHLAAQAIVREGYANPLETFSTNIMGTANLLEAIRSASSVKVAVMVTTDKVYQNKEWHYPYRETDSLGGHDPYSASKAASEHVIASYRDSFLSSQKTAVASARAGNVIAGGDWSTDRLIPDAVRAWDNDNPLIIRNPQSTRPWQHVLEPLAGYLRLAEKLWEKPELAGAFNFGPNANEASSVGKVIKLAQTIYQKGHVTLHKENNAPHEANLLSLEIAKSHALLSVQSKWNIEKTVTRTMNWYRLFSLGEKASLLCNEDINAYESL